MPHKYILGREAQNRSKIIRYCTVLGILLFLVAVFQTSVLARVKPFGVTPDLMITVVLAISFFLGCHAGGITGIVAGFLTDALGSVEFSLLPLIYFLIGYIIGYYVKVLNARGLVSYLITLAIALAVRLLTTLLSTLLLVQNFHIPTFLLSIALPELLCTAICGLAVFFPISFLCAWLKKRE